MNYCSPQNLKKPTFDSKNSRAAISKYSLKRTSVSDFRTMPCIEEEMDVLCKNCMKMIRISLVNDHSAHCIQVNSEVKFIEECSQSQQADHNIRKLRESLTSLLKESRELNKESTNCYYIKMIDTYAEDILNIVDYTQADLVTCWDILQNLKSLESNYKGGVGIKIYLQRLLSLGCEKYKEMIKFVTDVANINPELAIKKTSNELTNEFNIRSDEFRKSKDMAINMRITLNANKSEIDVFSPKRNELTDFEDPDKAIEKEYVPPIQKEEDHKPTDQIEEEEAKRSVNSEDNNIKDIEEALKEEEKAKLQKANLQRFFYSHMTKVKKTLGIDHKGYLADSKKMFKYVIQSKIPVDDWPNFIIEEITKRPEKWQDEKKIKLINKMYKI